MSASWLQVSGREGYETELASEIREACAASGIHGWARARQGQACAEFHCDDGDRVLTAEEVPALSDLVFARQAFLAVAKLSALPEDDRVTPIVAALQAHLPPPGTPVRVMLETADTNDGRELTAFCRSFSRPLEEGMRKAGWQVLRPNKGQDPTGEALRVHIHLISYQHAVLGLSLPARSSAWLGGIPRLRRASAAPSRSSLKLEEALLTLLTQRERQKFLRPGLSAVDLGAAPGGWSMVLASDGLEVLAIDNGPLKGPVTEMPQVRHLRADGFGYAPEAPVEWMVCDMLAAPERVAPLVEKWMARGWCRRSIFNLKLPAERRRPQLLACLEKLEAGLTQAGLAWTLRRKQLFHDRDEVTCYLALED